MNQEKVIVIDFGGQYNQLVARRVRECNVYCEIYSYKIDIEKIKEMNPKGVLMMKAINITRNSFENEVIRSEQKVLLDFWAPWCAPCRMVSPILDEIAAERPDIKVCKVNVEEELDLSSPFLQHWSPSNCMPQKYS